MFLFTLLASVFMCDLCFFQTWITMPKFYPCYYDPKYLISCTDKRKVNLRMECTIMEMLKEIEIWKSYLHKHWYTLKYFVHSLHAVYRLLYKIWSVFGTFGMCSKLKCHNLQDGPRPILQNLELFNELVVFTQIKTQIIGSIVQTKLCHNFQDTTSRLFYCLTLFLNKVIWNNNSTSNIFRKSLKVKMQFL